MGNHGGGISHKGRVIGGRYRLVERIGSGGMGTVWRALDQLVEREVAVEQPRLPGDLEDAEHQRAAHRLYREAPAAARVDPPAAVSIHDVVVEDGLPWTVMGLVRGGHPGVSVVDGSAVSADLGVNPARTITAQAERAMSHWPNKGEADQGPAQGAA